MEKHIIMTFVRVRRGQLGVKVRVCCSKSTDMQWRLSHHSSRAQSPVTTGSSTGPPLGDYIEQHRHDNPSPKHLTTLRATRRDAMATPLLIPLSPVIHGNRNLPFHPKWTVPSVCWPRGLVPCRSQMAMCPKAKLFWWDLLVESKYAEDQKTWLISPHEQQKLGWLASPPWSRFASCFLSICENVSSVVISQQVNLVYRTRLMEILCGRDKALRCLSSLQNSGHNM